MTNPISIRKIGYSWSFHCREHYERTWCETWEDAYELAAGHVAMHHPGRIIYLREKDSPEPLNWFGAVFLDVAANMMDASARGRSIREPRFLTWIADEIEYQSEGWPA